MKRCFALLLVLFSAMLSVSFAMADGLADVASNGEASSSTSLSAARAAKILRAATAAGSRGDAVEYAEFDLTQNGVLDNTDVQAALWAASGQIPDLVKFVERLSSGLLKETEFQRFSYGGSLSQKDGSYQSDWVSLTVSQHTAYDAVYYQADIYLQDLRCLATATPSGNHGDAGYVTGMARAVNAIIAINGDYYTQKKEGPIYRNGSRVISGITKNWDICVLTREGELRTYPAGELNKEEFASLNVYQSWVFGPALLDQNGKAYPSFSSEVFSRNPRAVMGYYAPGHYCFLLVDGRQNGYSAGLNLKQLAEVCESLGLAAAYNLDGGQSAEMASWEGLISKPYAGGRPVSDIVYIQDLPEEWQD